MSAELETFDRFCSGVLRKEDGSPFVLEDFQRRMLNDFFTGTTETLILMPKKCGKTTVLAALALYHLLSTPDAEVVIAAASRDQATILYDAAAGFVRRSERLPDLVYVRRGTRELRAVKDAGRIRVLAAGVDTADGVLPTLALVDEQHRHKSADLYGVFRDGLGPRQGRMITISTAGEDDMSPLGLMRRAAYELPGMERDGAYRYARSPDGGYVMHEWALEPDEDRTDMAIVKRANPASWQTEEQLRRRHDSPSMTAAQWARFACGVWMREEDNAISAVEWAACAEEYEGIPDGAEIRVGVDLAWKWDTAAIIPHHLRADGIALVGEPVIVVPPRDGTSTAKDELLRPILRLRDRYRITAVVMDPAADGEVFAQDLEEHGLEVFAHSQDPAPMSLAAERLMTSIREKTIRHPDHAELNSHVLNAALKATGGEKYRFVKPRSKRPIDGVIALAMVHSAAVGEPPPAAPEPWFAFV